jgi:glutaredoxin
MRARAWLDEHNIPYVEIDVDIDEEARSHASGLNGGRLHTPTFTLGDGVCVDFRPEKLRDLLGPQGG